MRRNRYEILGYAVWHGAKWYARKRLPSRRIMLIAGGGALLSLAGAAVLAKRLTSA